MGMFDYVTCQRKLPLTKEIKKAFANTDWSTAEFQTKDLDNTMTHYCITKSGLLTVLKIDGEHVRTMTEEEEQKSRKDRKFVWPYKFVEKSRKYEKTNYTGTVNFYLYDDDDSGNTWDVEITATFVSGKLRGMVLDSGKIITTAEQNKANEKEWQDRMEAYNNHPWTKTKKFLNKITFGYWNTFWNNVSKICYNLSREVSTWQMWIIKHML